VLTSPRKTVAIRGLDLELYHEIFSMAKREGKRISDVVNVALQEYIDIVSKNGGDGEDSESFILRNDGDITLSKRDVIGLNEEVGSFMIENTGRITFEKDIDKTSLKHIENIIIHSGTIEVPKTMYPHFLVKSEIHGKLEKY
jgi:hypothetical protein